MTYLLTTLALAAYLYYRYRGQKQVERQQALHIFLGYLQQLDRDRSARTGISPRYFQRLPPYESMLTDGLPLTLESYFFDSEIKKLRPAEQRAEKRKER